MKLTIVIYLTGEYETSHRRYMIEALAKVAVGQANILCVNPVVSPLGSLVRGKGNALQAAYRGSGLKQESDNLFVLTPHALLYSPLRRFLDLSGIALRHLRRQIEKALERIGNGRRVAWVYRPEHRYLLGLAKEELAVYECYDEYALSWFDPKPDPRMVALEDALLRQVDVVFTTSLALYDARKARHPSVHPMPNGANVDLFSQTLETTTPLPAKVSRIPGPRIGYLGDVTERLDFDLLRNLVASRPDWSFVCMGTTRSGTPAAFRRYIDERVNGLQSYPNFHLLGWVPDADVPGHLKGMDVVTIPYIVAERFRYVNSNKLWNYMAAGKVVVATDWAPEVRELADVVYIAKSPQDFAHCVQQALTSDNRDRIQRGIEVARQHRWEEITLKALGTVYAALGTKQPALAPGGTEEV